MTQQPEGPRAERGAETHVGTRSLDAPTLAEDLMLLLFQPDSGTIAGENTLSYVLAGAVLADLAAGEHITAAPSRMGFLNVEAVERRAPTDRILRSAWDYVAARPRGVQTVLAAIGPTLREPLLERLLTRRDLRQESRTTLGLFKTTVIVEGGNGRRARILSDVREVLAGGAEPTPRSAALSALLWGSGTLPQFDPVIPWTSPVIARAQELERGNWGAGAAAEAVTRTMTAIIAGSVLVAAAARPLG